MSVERILVVDDDPQVRELCHRILTRQGYEVHTVGTGQEALAAIVPQAFDLLVVDIALPDIDGDKVLRRAREIDPDLAAVAITGYGNMENAIRAMRAGAREFVIKPFGLQEFIDTVDEVLAARRRERERLTLRAQLPILQIAQAGMVESNIPEMARRFLEAVRGELGVDGAALLMGDERSGRLQLVGAVGLPKGREVDIPTDEPTLREAVTEGAPRIWPDAARMPAPWSLLLGSTAGGAVALVPLLWGGRTVGALLLSRPRTAGPFSPTQAHLLPLIGTQIAAAIENARLFETVSRGKREWEATFDAIADGISIHDSDFRIVRANRALAARLGTTVEALIGRRCYEAIHRTDHPAERCPCLRARNSGHGETSEWEESWLAGTFQVSAYPIRDEAGRLGSIVHVMRDITAARQMERELVRSEKMAALGRLAFALAHEINNPLQALRSGFHLLRNARASAQKRRQYLEVAQGEVERLIAIVERVLGFYRPAGEGIQWTDLNQIVEETLTLTAKQLEHGGVRVERFLDGNLPSVHAVPDQLKQVFLNLVLNALQAMPAGGTLQVRTSRRFSGEVQVSFSDSGCGIPPENLGRLFEPFYTSRPGGTGLGLAISYGIVERHGGRIEVESRVGVGSTFTVVLPSTPPEGAP